MDDEIDMFSESESEEALNIYIEQLEEKIEYYKNKSSNVFKHNMKLYIENERLKRKNKNLKAFLVSKLPAYLSAVIDCL